MKEYYVIKDCEIQGTDEKAQIRVGLIRAKNLEEAEAEFAICRYGKDYSLKECTL